MANANCASDMAQFFDFGAAALSDMPQEISQHNPATRSSEGYPNHDGAEDLTHTDVSHPAGIDFNTDFSSWLPRYQKPAHPCDYCHSKSLECFIYNADEPRQKQAGCSPCNALFRPCSFNMPERMPALRQRSALDTLDVVAENDVRQLGGFTGRKQLRSLGHMGPIEDDAHGEQGSKKGAAAARFPRAAVRILKEWIVQHIDHPYPSDEDKEALKEQTGLSVSQISNWMANTRRRQKSKRCASPSIRPSTEVINIPPGRTWESLNPFERWKHSPPENEPAPLVAIAQAVDAFDLPEPASYSSSYRKDTSNDSTGSFSVFRAPSVSSLETGFTNMSSGSLGSRNSNYSHGSRHSLGSMNSLKSKERRRRRQIVTRAPKTDLKDSSRLFQCTFCTDRFKVKYDWLRHEKSLHLSLEKWICAPLGEVITDTATGKRKCVYCDTLDPSDEHLANHNHGTCCEKGLSSRTFYRKDHLRQHLRLIHGCKMISSMDSWKSEAQYIKSRCGFCNENFDKWQDRVDHIAKEFRNGANMKDWKGCRGLDSHIAAQVTNAMPPYLIANESKSPLPFSASNAASMKHNITFGSTDLEYLINDGKPLPTTDLSTGLHNTTQSESSNGNSNATCWEVLTLHLGRFTRQHIERHGAHTLTDEMLQREARRILYDAPDDPWNQTAADNTEWLGLFKKAHGIDGNMQATAINSYQGIYDNEGVNANTFLESNLNGQKSTITSQAGEMFSDRQSPLNMPSLAGSASASPISPASRTPSVSQPGFLGVHAPISELACSDMPGKPCYGENGEMGFSVRRGSGSDKDRYWLNPTMAPFAPIHEQACTGMGEPIYECPKVGLGSFQAMQDPCSTLDTFMESINETPCTKAGEAIEFPTWDQLPAEFQNPTTSAGYVSAMPFSTTGASRTNVLEGGMGNAQSMRWDDSELMDFDMDLDVDMDLGTVGQPF